MGRGAPGQEALPGEHLHFEILHREEKNLAMELSLQRKILKS